MGKALVVKNANFGANKLATVVFSEAIPCIGIELDESTISITAIGETESLTPTLTPANTTDNVLWTSSNTSVATVNNGVITAVGIGSATITASCGNQSATCAVSVLSSPLVYASSLARYLHVGTSDFVQDYVYEEDGTAPYACFYSKTETEKSIWNSNKETVGLHYPIMIPAGATTVTITVPNTMRALVWFTDSTTACDYSAEHPTFDYLAKVISGDASAYDKNVQLGVRQVSVPAGADSILISLQYPNGTITQEIIDEITVIAT